MTKRKLIEFPWVWVYVQSERLTLEALISLCTATVKALLATGWQVTSGPEEERDGGRCDDGDEGESGDAHCGRKAEIGKKQ